MTIDGVPDGRGVLHALSDDYAPGQAYVRGRAGETTTHDFALNVGEPVTGTVTDAATGEPLPGVYIVTDTWSGHRMFNRQVYTDANGRYALPHMPPGEVETHFLEAGYTRPAGYPRHPRGRGRGAVESRSGISITVETAGGEPVPDGVVAQFGYTQGSRDFRFYTDNSAEGRNWNAETRIPSA